MKKAYSYLVILVWILALGCIGYMFMIGQAQFAIASLLNSAMAFPYVKSCYKKLFE